MLKIIETNKLIDKDNTVMTATQECALAILAAAGMKDAARNSDATASSFVIARAVELQVATQDKDLREAGIAKFAADVAADAATTATQAIAKRAGYQRFCTDKDGSFDPKKAAAQAKRAGNTAKNYAAFIVRAWTCGLTIEKGESLTSVKKRIAEVEEKAAKDAQSGTPEGMLSDSVANLAATVGLFGHGNDSVAAESLLTMAEMVSNLNTLFALSRGNDQSAAEAAPAIEELALEIAVSLERIQRIVGDVPATKADQGEALADMPEGMKAEAAQAEAA